MNWVKHWYQGLDNRIQYLISYLIEAVVTGIVVYIGVQQPPWIFALMLVVPILLAMYGANYASVKVNGIFKNIMKAVDQIAHGDINIKLRAGTSTQSQAIDATFAVMVKAINDMVSDVKTLTHTMIDGKLDTRADASKHAGEYKVIIEGLNGSLDAVIGPLNVAAEYVERISKGDIPQKITDSYNGDFNEIKNNLNHCIDGMNGLLESSNVLKKISANNYTSQVEGKYQGVFAEVAQYVNLIRVIFVLTVENNEKIAAGDFAEIYKLYTKLGKRCEEDSLTPSYLRLIESIQRLVVDAEMLADGAVAGKLDIRVDADQHQGAYRKVIEGINNTLDAVIGPLNVAAEYVERISKGDIPEKISDSYNGDFNEIKNNLNHCIDGLGGLVESSNVLKKMALNDYTSKVEGQYQGIFAETAQDVNTVRERLLRVVEINNSIAKGDFVHELEALNKIGRRSEADSLIPSMITSMENIQRLVSDAEMLAEGAIFGKLDIRADVAQHQGEYRKVIEGINNTLDAVIGPLNVAAEYIERIANGNTPPKITDNYNGDFNEIKNNLNTCIDEISILVEEIGVAINASVEGKLDQRADADRGKGVYRKILTGVNATMDALTAPVNEAILVVNEMAQGRLNVKMNGIYQGDNAKLKEAINFSMTILATVIGDVSEKIGQIAKGNLDISMDKDYMGDFGAISSALKQIIESLNEIMGDINNAAEEVAGGAGQLSDSSQSLAQGASEQASAIEQLTAAITEIAAQTKQNAYNANQANELALNARDNASQGDEQMKEMLGAMEGINDSSANISKIIKVIDEIAFQTNILALNAAVEAARAGQHGKGFAVVAEEVRNLAARSASAAKETTDLIEGSIRKVQSGTKIANETAQALKKIVDGVSQAAALVGDIAVASNEQATGIAQVDQGIIQVSQVVQSNSAIAHQSAGASEELSEQAGLLKRNVAKLRLKEKYINSQASNPREIAPGRRKLEAVASGSGKARIALDDGDFGKY